MPRWISVWVLFNAILLGGFVHAAAQDTLQAYECIAHVSDVGRDGPDRASPLARWPDGRLRLIEKGQSAYLRAPSKAALPDWIDLYGAQNGHGSSLLGYFQTGHFDCKAFQE